MISLMLAAMLMQDNVVDPAILQNQVNRAVKMLAERKGVPRGNVLKGPLQSTVCSVRLVEMEIPRDREYSMKILEAPKDFTTTMPEVKVPAPACEK